MTKTLTDEEQKKAVAELIVKSKKVLEAAVASNAKSLRAINAAAKQVEADFLDIDTTLVKLNKAEQKLAAQLVEAVVDSIENVVRAP